MGRKLTFCKKEALEDSMHLFWRKGYEATTMRELAAALGVPVASVYHSFGDKKSIFMATLDGYFERYVKPNFEALLARDNARLALLDMFHALAGQCDDDAMPVRCYLVQTANDLTNTDPELAASIREKLDYIRLQIKALVEKARRNKQLVTRETSENLTHYLFITMLAVKIWSRSGTDAAMTRQYLRLALKPLVA